MGGFFRRVLIFNLRRMNTMTQISDTQLRQTLSDILEKEPYGLEAEVIREALDYHDISDFFKDLMQHGCISGMIGSLIYYNDTHAFYDKHYSDIERMRTEYEKNIGEPLTIKGDLKNFLAWYAFEETAYQLVDKICLSFNH